MKAKTYYSLKTIKRKIWTGGKNFNAAAIYYAKYKKLMELIKEEVEKVNAREEKKCEH